MISIIIPVYNRSRYISECLNGVFAQTYKDYEIIIVDDGSTDHLKETLKPYSGRIRYIYQGNGGAARARNTGIINSRGEYVAFLDSDDVWLPHKLGLQIRILSDLPELGFVHTDFGHIDDRSSVLAETSARSFFNILDIYGITFESIYPNRARLREVCPGIPDGYKNISLYWGDLSPKLIYGPMYLTSSTLIRKKCINDTGLFNENYVTAEDFDHGSGQLSSYEMQVETYKAWLEIATCLWKEDAEFYSSNKKLVDWRLSHYYYALGTAYYAKKNFSMAVKSFIGSLKLNIRQKMVYLYLLTAAIKSITAGSPLEEIANG